MIIGIDLGSNTLRVALMDSDFTILKSKEFIVGSARNLKYGDNLSNEAKTNILKALKEIKKDYDFNEFKHVAVATEAFRMARDSKEFLQNIKDEFGINFEIIDGISESKFVNLAIKNRLKKLNIEDENLLCIDLGGASTEISYEKEFRSFKFGIIKFFNEFNSIEKMQENANLVVEKAREFIESLKINSIVLTSGVPTSLVALKLGLDYELYDANLVNGISLHYSDFDVYMEKILGMSEEEASAKLGNGRSIFVVAGIILLKELLKSFSNRHFIIVDDGLREGVMISTILNKFNEIKGIK